MDGAEGCFRKSDISLNTTCCLERTAPPNSPLLLRHEMKCPLVLLSSNSPPSSTSHPRSLPPCPMQIPWGSKSMRCSYLLPPSAPFHEVPVGPSPTCSP